MRNILPWRSHPVLPQLGSWGAGTEAPLCSGQKGWSPGRTWIFPISLSQMRPAWRNQCYWSCSSTCESNRHRFTSSKAPVMGYESANCSVKSRLSHWSGPALGPVQPSGPALVQSFFQDLSPAPGLCRVHCQQLALTETGRDTVRAGPVSATPLGSWQCRLQELGKGLDSLPPCLFLSSESHV